jgi:hypothetical protein
VTTPRAIVLTSLVFAAIFALVSLALGFGAVLSVASALVGAVFGQVFIGRASRQIDPPSRAVLEEVFRIGLPRGTQPTGIGMSSSDGRQNSGNALSALSRVLFAGAAYQRIASRAFFTQTVIGVFAIFLFWIAQASGLDLQLLDNPSLVGLFANTFPIDKGATVAKARFDNLFVPLVTLYVISLSVFVVAFLHSLGPIVRNMREHGIFLVGIPLFVSALLGILFYAGSSRNGLQKLIVGGHLWGYFAVFVIYPLFLMVLSVSLPNDRSR